MFYEIIIINAIGLAIILIVALASPIHQAANIPLLLFICSGVMALSSSLAALAGYLSRRNKDNED